VPRTPSPSGSLLETPASIRWLVACAGAYAVLGGLITLAGYLFDVRRLTDWTGGGISMFPNPALCAVASGVALLVLSFGDRERGRLIVRFLSLIVASLGGLTFLQHLLGLNLGIDTLLFNRSWGQRAATAPMRMGPPACVSFLIIGAAMFMATKGDVSRRVVSRLAILPIAIASLSIVGYWFGADRLFGMARFTGIAFQTSTMIAVLGVGLAAAVPEHGLVAMLRREDAGGLIARKLLLPVIVIPLVLAWLRLRGQSAGLYDTAFGSAALSLAMVALLLLILVRAANAVSRHSQVALAAEKAVRVSEARLAAVLEQIPAGVGVTDADGRWVLSNRIMREFIPSKVPSRDPHLRERWRTPGPRGGDLPPERWPSARALQG
jgi:PAS domain-containing protein